MRTFLVCNNVDCDERGSAAVLDEILNILESGDIGDVEVREYLCFSACEVGPNVVCVEDRVWYSQVGEADVEEIVAEHILGDRPVERLRPQGMATTENLIFASLEAGVLPGQI